MEDLEISRGTPDPERGDYRPRNTRLLIRMGGTVEHCLATSNHAERRGIQQHSLGLQVVAR